MHIALDCTNLVLMYSVPVWTTLILNSQFFFSLIFRDRVSLYSPGCPGAHFVDQAGLELRDPRIKGVRHHARLFFFCTNVFLKSYYLFYS